MKPQQRIARRVTAPWADLRAPPNRCLAACEAAEAWRRCHQADPEAGRIFADLIRLVSVQMPPADAVPEEDR